MRKFVGKHAQRSSDAKTAPTVSGENDSSPSRSGGTWAKLIYVAPNLYRNPDSGMYYARRKIEGRAHLRCLETADRKTADNKLADWLSIARKVNPTVSRSTLDELLKRFEETREACGDSTRTAEHGFANSFKEHFDCQRRVSSVTGSELKAFVNKLSVKRNYSANTFNRVCLFLKQLFDVAKNDGMTAQSTYELSGLRYQDVDRRPPEIPTQEQFDSILAEVRAKKKNRKAMASADLLEFEGRAGLGQAEAAALTWEKVNFNRSEMQIRRVKTGKFFTVPIYPKLRPLLERLHREAQERSEEQGNGLDLKSPVFVIESARKALTNACARLKLPEFTQRNLRQMFIVEAYRAGVDVKTIAKWQGHQDGGKLIMDTYTEVFGADQKEFEARQLAKLT